MKSHMNNDCPLKILTCDDCKVDLFRKEMNKHKSELCTERICVCPYSKYGCNDIVRAKEFDNHMIKQNVKHLI